MYKKSLTAEIHISDHNQKTTEPVDLVIIHYIPTHFAILKWSLLGNARLVYCYVMH